MTAKHAALMQTDGAVERRVETAPCALCGHALDFGQPDPLHIGRVMVRCSNDRCVDRSLRPMPICRL